MNPSDRQETTGPKPHAGQPVRTEGPPPEQADATLLLVHGRGGSAEDMLSLYQELALPRIAALAPRRQGPPGTRTRSWRRSKRISRVSMRRWTDWSHS
jgi:predicted esterase